MFVAKKKEKIVGFSSLFKDEVRAVYVHPDYTRQRVGKMLLSVVEKKAQTRNIKKLKLSSSLTAIPFYSALGYEAIEYSHHKLRSGVQIPCAVMRKYLRRSLG